MDDSHVRPAGFERQRLVPDEPFPPYSYVTGRFPHPITDPAGHSFGAIPEPISAPASNQWRDCRTHLYALDLFNHGYYWEAHEAWEALWHASGRAGAAADFFKGLIKLAAAGVKAREGRPEGVRTHGRRAAELFEQIAAGLPPEQNHYFGLALPRLVALANGVAGGSLVARLSNEAPVEIVFPFVLWPDDQHRSQEPA
jgi:hypothetical protein